MTSKTAYTPYRYSPSKADISSNWRTTFIEPEIPTKPKKTYSLMKLEDYLPYKEERAALPIGLFGPSPFNPSTCACNRYIVDDYCACAMSCLGTPKALWAKQNPDAYKAEQATMARWKKIWYEWYHQWSAVEDTIWRRTAHIVNTFERLRDAESIDGCYQCESDGYKYCCCRLCQGCGDKYCCGCESGDDGYDSY